MPFRASSHIRLPILAATLSLAACSDVTPTLAPNDATETAVPTVLAKAPARPTGTGIGLIGPNAQRTPLPVDYHGGPMMFSTSRVYLIWYGLWGGSPTTTIVTDLVSSIGGSSYLDVLTRYGNNAGMRMPNAVQYNGSFDDVYSRGTSLANYDIGIIVSNAVANGSLPPDPEGLYVVLTTADVEETSGFGTKYCGFHSVTSANGITLKTIFVGNPDRVPTKCKPQAVGPNGNTAADAIANVLVNEMVDAMLDPEFTGWYDRFALEPADKCAWSFGKTYKAPNGANANVAIGGRNYLLQELWVPDARGFCTLDVRAAR
jgi:hypothetical protein